MSSNDSSSKKILGCSTEKFKLPKGERLYISTLEKFIEYDVAMQKLTAYNEKRNKASSSKVQGSSTDRKDPAASTGPKKTHNDGY